MSIIKTFQDLITWREGHKLVINTYKVTENFPKKETFGLSSQIQRAAVSITSNIAEGFSRKTNKEKIQFYYISLGSLTELQNQFLIAKDLGYMNENTFRSTYKQTISVQQLLNALITSTKKNANRNNLDSSQNSKLKTQNSNIISILLAFCALTIFQFINPTPIHAQSSTTSFGVDPLKFEFSLSGEEPLTKEIRIYNLTNSEANYQISVEKFNIVGEQGNLVFEEVKKKDLQITFDKNSVTIPANSSETITATFQGVKNLQSKEFLYVILITPESTNTEIGGSGSNVLGKIGILTFINYSSNGEVLGEFTKSGRIVEFSVEKKWNFFSPANFTARVSSTGNTHFNAYGTVQVKNNNGEILKTIALEKATIIAGSTRILNENGKENLTWDFMTHIGKDTAVLEVKSDDGEVVLTKEITFYTIPLNVIIPIIIIFVSSIILLIKLLNSYRKRVNKKEITKTA